MSLNSAAGVGGEQIACESGTHADSCASTAVGPAPRGAAAAGGITCCAQNAPQVFTGPRTSSARADDVASAVNALGRSVAAAASASNSRKGLGPPVLCLWRRSCIVVRRSSLNEQRRRCCMRRCRRRLADSRSMALREPPMDSEVGWSGDIGGITQRSSTSDLHSHEREREGPAERVNTDLFGGILREFCSGGSRLRTRRRKWRKKIGRRLEAGRMEHEVHWLVSSVSTAARWTA
jgi:hypothetical protein